ncbi:BCCT family transporter [Aromatoleum petrolei]|uniref:BCCT family transporter n=1 Tax=Aromatoleum petrolei TaxID=76116 RepID=A0ABX1MH63_9RHOO|nr:BCCT family transporter [Aromatoleum petrolei]NMF87292.1 BCCT family transporter [Aromatoleum petrolei]QTQ38537.1 BCCT family transporter [Aromatoleum petrolei]
MSVSHSLALEPGIDNKQLWGMDFHNPVFPISAGFTLLFILYALFDPATASAQMVAARTWAIEHFDWLFMFAGNAFVLFCFALILLPVGKVRLGGATARPEYSTMSWFAMLFAAGMGIGLMFWSVAEPVAYYTDWYGTPLNAPARTPEGASAAMGATMFHWGLHPWAIYAVVAVAIGFFTFNMGLPLSLRAAFFPLLGNKVRGWPGHLIDILAVLATIFGLATSLGLGATQAASGLHFLTGAENSIDLQIWIIVVVSCVTVLSVWRGIDGGVKLLSNINMVLATTLMVFVAFAGGIVAYFGWLGATASDYASHLFQLSNWIGREDDKWLHGWTVFYWAWWISWSPFVGIFIARISKGRTVRAMVTAVLIVPTLVTLLWMTAFGGNALAQTTGGIGELAKGISDVSLPLFQMLANMPLSSVTSLLAVMLVLVFFVTSADSGALVIDCITAGGKVDAPRRQKVLWACLVGVIAAILLSAGGTDALNALQAGAVTAGLPFTVVLLVMLIGLYKALHECHYA